MRRFAVLPGLCLLLAACSSQPDKTHKKTGVGDGGPIGGDRPVTPYVPASYDPSKPAPLVVLLHGYGASGLAQELLFDLKPRADKYGFIYLYPNGTVDSTGKRFWNATDACCDFDNTGIDDSAYIEGLINETESIYNIDPKRVYLVGHSNGAFMAYRMACDHADTIAAAVSLAGAMYSDVSKCKPSGPVSILQVHGTDDQSVLYDGSNINGDTYPGAKTSVADWAKFDGCAATPTSGAPLERHRGARQGNERGNLRGLQERHSIRAVDDAGRGPHPGHQRRLARQRHRLPDEAPEAVAAVRLSGRTRG